MASYNRRLVEHLMPTVWDRSFAYGLANSSAPDPDMPRSKANPKESGTLWAHLADIRVGWKKAPLSVAERRALLCHFALGWTDQEIAALDGVTDRAVRYRIERGVGWIVATLNGTEYVEVDQSEDEPITVG